MWSLIQHRQIKSYVCQKKKSRIVWVWQYMYKAFVARNNVHSLKIMYKALLKTLQKSSKPENASWNFSFWLHRMTLLTLLAYNALVTATEHLLMQYKNLKYFRGHVMMRWNKKTSVAYINTYIHKHMYTYTHTFFFDLHMRSVKIASYFLFVGLLSNTRTLFAMISFNYENTGLKGNKS